MENGLTIHCVIRNEPFIYYAIKSVYKYATKILLYDTISYDKHTLKDIQTLLDEDYDHKIDFQQVPIAVDETKWQTKSYLRRREFAVGKRGVWYVRQKQIDDTKTQWFMVVDGDEIHYRRTMERIVKICTLENWPEGKICGFVSLNWFYDLNCIFPAYDITGRLFLTDRIGMTKKSPGEIHTNRDTGEIITSDAECSFKVAGLTPFVHFEKFLKPWRREVYLSRLSEYTGKFPEVMVENWDYVDRFLNERKMVNSEGN